MTEEEGWVTGPALKIILVIKAVQPGDLVMTRRGVFRVFAVCASPQTKFTNPKDKPFCLAPTDESGWGLWSNSQEPVLAWKRPKKVG